MTLQRVGGCPLILMGVPDRREVAAISEDASSRIVTVGGMAVDPDLGGVSVASPWSSALCTGRAHPPGGVL